jgi:hypothetical protein
LFGRAGLRSASTKTLQSWPLSFITRRLGTDP